MNSSEIVKEYNVIMPGQQFLFKDDDATLRRTRFKSIDPVFDKEAIIHWWMNVYTPTNCIETSQEVYSSWHCAVHANFKYIGIAGYNCGTLQSAIRFAAYKKDPIEEQLEELQMWLPHIRPSVDENGRGDRKAKHVSILERTLSQYACYSMSVYNDNEITVNSLAYGSHNVLKKFDNLKYVISFIRARHWYKK